VNSNLLSKRASELVGKDVYDTTGSLIGGVVDVELHTDKAFCLIVSTQKASSRAESTEQVIEANEIATVKDVILLKTTRKPQLRRCPECGHSNPTVAMYCRECGTKLTGTDYPVIRTQQH
jgi:sporulation protein YlmC with PRC-barrel domain